MALNFLLKRSGTASKRPDPTSMALGEIDLNYDSVTGGIYYKDSAGNAVKVGPCQVSATAPNSSPAGSAGNSAGEFWYDTSTNTLKVYSGTTWEETGGAVQGITVSSPLTVDNTDPLNPILGIDSASTTGAGAVQLDDTVTSTSTTEAATANAVKTAYDLADAALPKSGGTMTGDITFAGTQSFPVSGIADATTTTKGLVEIGTNIDVAAGVISVASASTTGVGVVQLEDTVTSTSTTLALTANQGKVLQDQISALATGNNLTFAGTIDASTGLVASVSTEGTAAGFTVGQALPAAATGNAEYFVIVITPGTFTPPGGAATTANDGDWFISDGTTTYTYIPAGWTPVSASETEAGLVELATDAEVQTGTDTTRAVTPAGLQSKLSDSTSTTSSTTIASSTAVKSAYDLADSKVVGVTGTSPINVDNNDPKNPVVEVDAASTTAAGVVQLNDTVTSTSTTEAATANAVKTAYDLADAAVPDNTFTAIGEVLVGTGASTYTVLAPGTAGQFLQSNGAGQQLTWEDVPPSPIASYTANKALTSATPINLLEWDTGVRMGTLVVMATDNSTNHAWANISIGADTGIGTSAVTTQSTGVGTFAVIAGGGGETVVEFTPSVTLASVDFVYQYTAAFGAQPTVL